MYPLIVTYLKDAPLVRFVMLFSQLQRRPDEPVTRTSFRARLPAVVSTVPNRRARRPSALVRSDSGMADAV